MKKVFCCNCRFIRSWSCAFGGVGLSCKKAKVVSMKNEPIQQVIEIEEPCEKNKTNNCADFQKASWYHKIIANTNG